VGSGLTPRHKIDGSKKKNYPTTMPPDTDLDNDVGAVDCYKLYGYNWDQCGYCRGGRTASSQEPHISSNGSDGHFEQQQQQQRPPDDDNNNEAAESSVAPPPSSTGSPRSNTSTYRSYLTKLDSPMRPSSYEALMCRGWRRSGTIVYLPDNATTCCPQHSIRLPVANFCMNKEQKKVLRKMKCNKKQRQNDAVMAFLARNGVLASLVRETQTQLDNLLTEDDSFKTETMPPIRYKLHSLTTNGTTSTTASLSCPVCTVLAARKVIDKPAAAILANRLAQRLQSSQDVSSIISSISSTTAGMLRVEVNVPNEALLAAADRSTLHDPLAAWFHAKRMDVPTDRSVQINTLAATESAATDPRVHQLYWDYQNAVHGDVHPLKSSSTSSSATTTATTDEDQHNGPGSSVVVDARAMPMLERTYGAGGSSSSGKAPWQAFASFWDFLVHSPLGSSTIHQHYTIGDALVAVGVLDILPTGISSVYCFYDPTFAKLVPLGTYTAVQEIEYTRSLQRPYYYLGYYIESNPKMNYKGDYIGSQIRCTVTGEWVGVDDARKVLRCDERARLVVRSDYGQHEPPVVATTAMVDVGKIPILSNQGIIYGNILQDEDKEYFYPFLEEWVSLAGPDVAMTGTVDIRE
jgi:arginyl-tRNA--protein-N-Asp/Glu arginylyltransferase